MIPHVDLTSVCYLLPGMVRVRNEQGPKNDNSKGPKMRFNWYDLAKALFGYAIASVVVVVTMRGEINTLKEVHIAQHAQLNETIMRMNNELNNTIAAMHRIEQEQAQRSDAVNWARQRMHSGQR